MSKFIRMSVHEATQTAPAAEQDAPLFSDRRERLYAEPRDSEPLFDPSHLRHRTTTRSPLSATQQHSGIIDLAALTGAEPWSPYASTVGTLLGEVAESAPSPRPVAKPSRRPLAKLRRWLLRGTTA